MGQIGARSLHIHIDSIIIIIVDDDNGDDGHAGCRPRGVRTCGGAGPAHDGSKDHWRRYIYLWIYYAVFEEMIMKDTKRASKVYETCLQIIPHKSFSFAKVWIHAAHLHIRRKDFQSARKVLGRAIGMCGKERIYMEYIHLELALGEIDR